MVAQDRRGKRILYQSLVNEILHGEMREGELVNSET